jgi:hypothetical protein
VLQVLFVKIQSVFQLFGPLPRQTKKTTIAVAIIITNTSLGPNKTASIVYPKKVHRCLKRLIIVFWVCMSTVFFCFGQSSVGKKFHFLFALIDELAKLKVQKRLFERENQNEYDMSAVVDGTDPFR